jgi:hypothetical protein
MCGLLAASDALADVGKVWTAAGAEQFAKGKLDGVSVLSTGEIELAPEVVKIEGLEAGFVWDIAVANDGTAYAATGSPAAVYRIQGDHAELLYKSDQQHVLSVLPLDDGSVLAGTAPKGIIYRINRRGEASVFVDLEDQYVWDMALDPFNHIHCATGPDGRLVELNREGEVTERLKVKQNNLMCVVADREGTVYVGTDTDGYVYRVEMNGPASVLYDADESEVRSLAVDENGVVYACTAQPSRQAGPPQPAEPKPGGAGPASAQPLASRWGTPAAANSVYRIVPGKGATRVASFSNLFLFSLALAENRVLTGTGPGGRVMSVDADGLTRIVVELPGANVTAMAAAADGDLIVGTSNAGGLWRLKKGCRELGSFISKPFDAEYLAHWGRLWWQEKAATGQSVRIKVRTGNSGEPDQYWSDWSRWANDRAGQDLDLPLGRFAQFCAELRTRPVTGTPSLLEVDLSCRQANQEPNIQELSVDGVPSPQGQEERRPASEPRREAPGPSAARPSGPPRREKQVTWKATDPNGDELVFDLYYRALDEHDWKPLEKDIKGTTSYKWDTSRVPDGYYLLRLVASDRRVRPQSEALAAERIGHPILVDNRPPAIEGLTARRQADGSYEITGLAADDQGYITGIEVSRNSGDWAPVFPTDGVLDGPREAFSYRTQVLEPGEHVFVFSATDNSMNTGSGKLVLVVPQPRL